MRRLAVRCWQSDRKTKAQSKGDIHAQGKSERHRPYHDELLAPQLSQGSDGGGRKWRCRATATRDRSRLWEVHSSGNEGGGGPEGRCDHGGSVLRVHRRKRKPRGVRI